MKLIKDSLWVLLSIAIPAVIAIPAFAIINKQVGTELFGIFTLSFAIIGYASIFDLGLSRAVIREVAMNDNNANAITAIINTAFTMMSVLSLLAVLVIWGISANLVGLLSVSGGYQNDVISGFKWLAVCVPFLLISQIFLAYFEGLAEFRALSLVRTLGNVLIVVLPCVASFIEPSFTALMIAMLLARVMVFLCSVGWIVKRITIRPVFDVVMSKRLLGFGGWLTVSTVVGPIMVYFDRFVLSSIGGAKNVAFYTAPSELVMRMLSLPSAASRTLFSRLSRTPNGKEQTIYRLSVLLLGVVSFLFALPFFVFAEEILVLWLGQEFAQSAWVFRILLIGFVFNAIAQVPYTSLQAKGLSKQTAMVHCSELIPYIILLIFLVKYYGLIGVAVAWTLRTLIDMAVFLILDTKFQTGTKL